MEHVGLGLLKVENRDTVVKQYVDVVKAPYDYVLIDSHPSLGTLEVGVMAAADSVIIPCEAQYYSAEDMSDLIKVVRKVQADINPALKIDGVVLTKVDNTVLTSDFCRMVREDYAPVVHIFRTAIPATTRLARTIVDGTSIFNLKLYDSAKRNAATAFAALAKEVVNIERTKSVDRGR